MLALEAESQIKDAKKPLFLRFIELLIDDSYDAINLLDKSLHYMAQLKEQKAERSDVPAGPKRHKREATFQKIAMLARLHNVMVRETIGVLEMLTSEVKEVFVHSIIVDRVAFTLQYFLLQLVGPEKRDFKVLDMFPFLVNNTFLIFKIDLLGRRLS